MSYCTVTPRHRVPTHKHMDVSRAHQLQEHVGALKKVLQTTGFCTMILQQTGKTDVFCFFISSLICCGTYFICTADLLSSTWSLNVSTRFDAVRFLLTGFLSLIFTVFLLFNFHFRETLRGFLALFLNVGQDLGILRTSFMQKQSHHSIKNTKTNSAALRLNVRHSKDQESSIEA